MAHRKDHHDDLGPLLRWGLEDWVAGAEPPDEVWHGILSRVRGMQANPARSRVEQRRPFSLAPVLQAVVVSALVLALGLGVDRNLAPPRPELMVRPTPAVKVIGTDQDRVDDMLRGYLLVRREQEPISRQRLGGMHP